MTDEQRKINQISDAILDLIDDADALTRSDLQGVVQALSIQIVKGL